MCIMHINYTYILNWQNNKISCCELVKFKEILVRNVLLVFKLKIKINISNYNMFSGLRTLNLINYRVNHKKIKVKL